jgi:hypothetical protein
MKSIIFVLNILLIQSFLLAQNEIKRIKLPVNYTRDFEFINNNHGNACLFFDLGESYYIALLDSNYQVLTEFKDKYYTSKKPEFVGSIANEERFELFFTRVEDDVLLVLIIEIENRKLTRIKDFKICGKSEKKVIYTGSNFSGNKMITISLDQNGINYKEHLFGLKTRNTHIQLKPEDYKIFKKSEWIQYKCNGDSLIMLYRIENIKNNNPYYKIFNFDIKSGLYNTFDIVCNQKRKQPYLHCRFYKDVVLLGNCQSDLKLFDRITGNLIKDLSIDFDAIVKNENIKMFKYSYGNKFKVKNEKKQYTYLTGEDRKILPYLDKIFDFNKDSTDIYLEIFSKFTFNSNGSYYKVRMYVPFNWEEKSIIENPPEYIPPINDYIIYEIDKQQSNKIVLSDYFWGFKNDFLFGYKLKKSKEFVIEKVKFE